MAFPQINNRIQKRSAQQMQLQGINLTDAYEAGQLESSNGICTDRFPYITTSQKLVPVETGIAEGYHAVSMYPWNDLVVISDEPGETGYKIFYGGQCVGDAPTIDLPKQYAVINSKLVIFPDKIMLTQSDEGVVVESLNTASLLKRVSTGSIEYRKAEQNGDS